MSDSQNHGLGAADGENGTIGRGSGFTIQEMKRRMKEFFRRKKIPTKTGQWRTLKQKLPEQYRQLRHEQVEMRKAEVKSERQSTAPPPVSPRMDFKPARQHPIDDGGIKLKKFGKSVWDEL